jgi:hypothetical protein
MAKKKQPAKTKPPALAPAKEDLATLVFCVKQHQLELYKAIMAQGWEQTYNLVKAMITRTLEKGRASIFEEEKKEGFEKGQEVGKTERELLKNEEPAIHINVATQMPTTTANAIMQTASQDEPSHLLRDAGMSTKTLSTSQPAPSPTIPSPQPALLPATSWPTTYTSHHTATSQLPTPLTTATTAPSAPQKQ